jgi:hypothetical protein
MFLAYKFRLWTKANQERELGIMLETHRSPYRIRTRKPTCFSRGMNWTSERVFCSAMAVKRELGEVLTTT